MIDSGVDDVVRVLIEHSGQNLRVLAVNVRWLSLTQVVRRFNWSPPLSTEIGDKVCFGLKLLDLV